MSKFTKLDKDLDLYGKHSAPSSKLNPAKLLTYTAAASSAFVFSATADAAVIYSGTKNVGLNTPVDINGDGIDDIEMIVSSFILTSALATTSSFNRARLKTPNDNVGFIQVKPEIVGQPPGDIEKLSSGDTISAGALFDVGTGLFHSFATNTFQPPLSFGQWGNNTASSGFAGLKINDNSTDIYAWLRFKVEHNDKGLPVNITLLDWAYEDTGAPILAGETASAVPLPGSLGLLAMGATGLAAFRRRKPPKQ